MREPTVTPTGVERFFPEDEVIVSKTDFKGRITYANETFLNIAGFTEDEILGQPHSIIRHPDMPRCVFKLLWDTIKARSEIFAYVLNMAKNGDHYWVFAHVTPTFDASGKNHRLSFEPPRSRPPAGRAVFGHLPATAGRRAPPRRLENRHGRGYQDASIHDCR